jgi:outer membrane protein
MVQSSITVAAAFVLAQAQPGTQSGLRAPLSLQQATQIALERNPDLRHAQFAERQAETDLVAARAAILPKVDFNASAGRLFVGAGLTFSGTVPINQATELTTWTYGLGLGVRQLVFDGGKWWNNIASAKSGLEAGRRATAEQRLQVGFLVAQRFYDLVRAQRFARVMAAAAARSAEQATATDRLAPAGKATQADVLAARANHANDAVAHRRQAAVAEQARLDLAGAIGLEPSEPLEIAEPMNFEQMPPAAPAVTESVERALKERPALQAMEAQARAQEQLARALAGDYWPTVSLQASYARDATTVRQLFGPPDETSIAYAGVAFTWNLFNGLANKAQTDRARLQAQMLASDLQAARRNVVIEVEKALSGFAAAVEGVQLSADAERAAVEGLQLARSRQQQGAGSQFEVRDAELRLTQSQLSRIAALADARIAEAALRRAIGAP